MGRKIYENIEEVPEDEMECESMALKEVLDAQLSSLEPMNFITQCFNMTHRCLSLCITGLDTKYQDTVAYSRRLDRSPAALPQIIVSNMHMLSIDATLYDPEFAKSVILFCGHTINYFGSAKVGDRPPLPVHYIQNVTAFMQMCRNRDPNLMELAEELSYRHSTSKLPSKLATFNGITVTEDIIK